MSEVFSLRPHAATAAGGVTGLRQRYPQLDAMRGIAAILVVIYHCIGLHIRSGGSDAPWDWHRANWSDLLYFSPLHLFWDGEDAVVFFFVLSGFVLCLGFQDGRFPSYGAYLTRRLLRLYPALIFAIFLATCVVLFFDPPRLVSLQTWLPGQRGMPLTLQKLAGHLLLIGGVEYEALDGSIWSMVHELRISIIFPLLMLLLRRGGVWLSLAAFISLVGSIAAGRFLLMGPQAYVLMRTFHYLPFFALGALMAHYRHALAAWLPNSGACAAIFIIALNLFCLRWYMPIGETAGDLAAGGSSAVLIALALGWRRFADALLAPTLQWLGTISYSLYLIHMPIIAFGVYALVGFLPLWVILALSVLVSIGTAHFMASCIERPAIALGRRLTLART